MHKVLVTGGAGFVGRHLIKRLLDEGYQVHCVDNLMPGTGAIDPRTERQWPLYSPLDYRNFHFCAEDCRDYFRRVKDDDFDYAFHLAAVVGGRWMIENRPLAVADDLSIDSHYWQWAVEAKPKKTVCFSSSAAYPVSYQCRENYVLLKEDMISFEEGHLGMPDLSYGWAKLTHEFLARLAYEKYGIRSVSYRPFSGYGEDQDDSYPFTGICRRALSLADRRVLTVWGDGDQMRDFIHIEDCIRGILMTMDKIDNGDALNLSTGTFTSFKTLASMVANECGFTPKVCGMSDMPAGVFARAGDTTKQKAYGFCHDLSLEEGVRRAVRFLVNQS
jgi:nucleoside-diphosphate-sugar epimerase